MHEVCAVMFASRGPSLGCRSRALAESPDICGGSDEEGQTIPISEVPTDVFQEVTAKAGAQNVYAACIVRPALILKPQFGSSHSKCDLPAELELKMYEGHMAVTPRQEVESFSWDTSKEDAQADRYMPHLNQLMGSQDR